MNKIKAYSDILQDFANPLLDDRDSNEIFLIKLKASQLVWNYCISKEFALASLSVFEDIMNSSRKTNPEIKQIFLMLINRKKQFFQQYKNFITDVRIMQKPDKSYSIQTDFIKQKDFKEVKL